ncbi:hypothetical protein C8035_v004540 [Colletotrichum spinosum]|uniref:Uncharacterized protein n=1 Tax=Colletotrichum spinosum TaxID=1347390 RepID=A0A4R8PTQ3_9PEZI|nr:hypothetical protein C8035_v004540 [Colletotrichum spinosum]
MAVKNKPGKKARMRARKCLQKATNADHLFTPPVQPTDTGPRSSNSHEPNCQRPSQGIKDGKAAQNRRRANRRSTRHDMDLNLLASSFRKTAEWVKLKISKIEAQQRFVTDSTERAMRKTFASIDEVQAENRLLKAQVRCLERQVQALEAAQKTESLDNKN